MIRIIIISLAFLFSNVLRAQTDFDPSKLKRNHSIDKERIPHKEIDITVPIHWEVWSKSDTKKLVEEINKHSEYRMDFDYYLTLKEQTDYPNITIIIKESEDFEDISFDYFKDYFKSLYGQMTETVLEGMDSFLTDHQDESFIVDRKNKRLFVKSIGTVANVGSVKSHCVVVLSGKYLININYSSTMETYKDYESALLIMANSIKTRNQ